MVPSRPEQAQNPPASESGAPSQRQKGKGRPAESPILFGVNMLNNRMGFGNGAPEFNIMDHLGLVLGPLPFHHPSRLDQTSAAKTASAPKRFNKPKKRHALDIPESPSQSGPCAPKLVPELRPYQEETVRSRLRKEFYPFTNY